MVTRQPQALRRLLQVICRDLRNCGRRWYPLVHRTWLRDREAVIRRALQEHGGPLLVIAITQTHKPGWWDCDGSGHAGLLCSGLRGCKVKAEVVERKTIFSLSGVARC